ncbi:MAG: hypothetical protein ACK5MF_06380 [Vibrio sp.]|uniref:hypothetical protein n=1 Tax=Vibrio sp. TaxID=678 RepID=UPI003A85B2BB
MARKIPLGATRYAGNSDVVSACVFEGELVAGVAVSSVAVSGSQPTVTTYNGTAFAGFAVHDLCSVRKVTGVIEQGKSICLRVKEGEALSVGNAFAVDNVTGEVVAAGADGSTTIMGKVDEIDVVGLDENSEEVENCVLVTAYGGTAPAGTGGSTGIEEAPVDGTPYNRQDASWVAASAAAAAPTPESASSKTAKK